MDSSVMEPTVTVTDGTANEALPQPAAPPALTRKQLGQLRRHYLTVTHGTVKACGHKAKFSATKQPNNNCVDCWKAFFYTVADLEALHKTLIEKGVKELEKTYGTKFVRNFHGFLAVALQQSATQEQNG